MLEGRNGHYSSLTWLCYETQELKHSENSYVPSLGVTWRDFQSLAPLPFVTLSPDTPQFLLQYSRTSLSGLERLISPAQNRTFFFCWKPRFGGYLCTRCCTGSWFKNEPEPLAAFWLNQELISLQTLCYSGIPQCEVFQNTNFARSSTCETVGREGTEKEECWECGGTNWPMSPAVDGFKS